MPPFPSVTALIVFWLVAILPVFAQTAEKDAISIELQRADTLQDKGSLAEARKIYESLLRRIEGRGLSPELGLIRNALCDLASSEGNYDEAIASAQEGASVYHKLGNTSGEINALNCRGIAEMQRALYPEAQSTLGEALALSRAANDALNIVRVLNNLGTTQYYLGRYLEALRAYQEAESVLTRNTSEKWYDYWRQISAINRATLYQRLGRYENALRIYQQISSSSKALTAGDRAHLLTNLGVLYRRQGDPWKALSNYQEALRLYQKAQDSDGEISALKNIGIVFALDRNDLRSAEPIFEHILDLASKTHNDRERMQAHLYLGETRLRKGDLAGAQREFQKAVSEAKKLDTREEQWKALYGLARTEELSGHLDQAEQAYGEAIAIIEASRSQLQIPSLRAEFLADKRDAYDAMIALLVRKNDIKGVFNFLERSRARTFQDRLTKNGSGPSAAAAVPTLDEVRSQLDASAILLEYWVTKDQIALLWCTRASYGMTQKKLSTLDLNAALAYLSALPENLDSDWRIGIGVLGKVLPPMDLPRDANFHSLVIVPDGWLGSMPFDLLRAGNNSDALLIERFSISYLPTAALLRRAPQPASWESPWALQLVAFGDPAVHQSLNSSLENGAPPAALPYSGEEIQSLAAMAHGKTKLFLGSTDLKRIFLSAEANGAPILHVSTHAFADADNPENSRILFSPESPQEQPDNVFLRELYELKLDRVSLATLSACNTERGKMIRGEGIQGFSRALLSSGSRSALTTLWRVDDQPTSEFMKQFYHYAIQEHQSKAEALRSAKLTFLRSGTGLGNPTNWAGFVLNGDGFGTLPTFVSWTQILAALAAIVAAGIVGSLWFRSQRLLANHSRSRD